jgi:hypothetical protein
MGEAGIIQVSWRNGSILSEGEADEIGEVGSIKIVSLYDFDSLCKEVCKVHSKHSPVLKKYGDTIFSHVQQSSHFVNFNRFENRIFSASFEFRLLSAWQLGQRALKL